MAVNFIDFVSGLVYGNPGGGATNHLNWTLDRIAASPAAPGQDFLNHHLDMMLNRYESWRSASFLPPVRPWDGSDVFPHEGDPPVGPAIPSSLAGGPFPPGWTTNDLGVAVETFYDTLRNFISGGRTTELDDEVKAPFTYRYWAFMKWVSDLRKRLLGQPVFPVGPVYDRDGTILSEKEFTDFFNQTHHVWHPNSGLPASWTQATPGFSTSVGQHRRKQQVSRAQVGAEFFAFHRDHLLLFDRWLARTGQDPVQSINMCAHDTTGGPPPAPPAGLDVNGGGLGYPVVNYVTRVVDFTPPHDNMWDGTRPGFDGTLREFSSLGEMGQFFALDFNPFPQMPTPPGAAVADAGYHGPGHVLNGDIRTPFVNNYVPRFFAWHGFIDELWAKRQPRLLTFVPADFPAAPTPRVLTIVRDLAAGTDTIEPAGAIPGVDLVTGNGTLRCRLRVRPDPFNRPLELKLRCEVLREATGPTPLISLPPRTLVVTVGPPAAANERQQGVDFVEDFVFDGSAGTVDAAGKGPFASDNTSFPPVGPSAAGFLNSLIRVTGTLTCKQRPDGSTPAAPGTISSAATAVTGNATSFQAQTAFKDGDLIQAAGQVRVVTQVASNTSLTLLSPFTPDLPAGTPYQKLDGFDAVETVEIPLIQEKQAPDITVYLDRSTFSKDQVDAVVSGGHSVFGNAFYIVVQDRTARPAPIAWPPDVEPQLYGLIAPPVLAAGLFFDLAHAPAVELRDAATNAPLAGTVDVNVTAVDPEDPSLHPSVPQRITYRCQVDFTGNTAFAGMNPGDFKDMKLVVTATDRAGNQTTDDSSRVRLQVSANPYILDGPISWISTDTRVFQVTQGQARFGVAAGWSDPNLFVAQVIDNLRAGNGTAGGESFDGLPTDQASAVLEYSTQVGGVNVYNFALAKVRLQSLTGAAGVRASFRLFRWGVANVSFDNTLSYRTEPASGVALLGRTTSGELASIPFFCQPRIPLTASMTTQSDPKNVEDFAPTGGGEALLFYGAYLDINQTQLRFPLTFVGDGPFNAVPPADLRTIRDLLVSHHQCMVIEIYYPPDPTDTGDTPGTSDNLAQRNLLILRTANPGSEATRTVQHSFDIDLTRRRPRRPIEIEHTQARHGAPHHPDEHTDDHLAMPRPARPPADPPHGAPHHGPDVLRESWLGQDPEVIEELIARNHTAEQEESRWQIDADQWKRTDGIDELVFFWNDLPYDSRIDLYLPDASAEEIFNYRSLRHAPGTVKIVDSHTLRLLPTGPTYLPIPPYWADNLAGLVTVTLPPGSRVGERYTIDVMQVRSDQRRTLGGFQINIQVGKAAELYEAEKRMLELFHQRLSVTPRTSRWWPVLQRQVDFFRERARGLAELADEPWEDPTTTQHGQKLRLVLERIQILDDHDPFLKLAGEFRFVARVSSTSNGGLSQETKFPPKGHYTISDKPAHNTVHLDLPVFEGFVQDDLAVEITGIEMDTFDPDDKLCPYRRVFTGPPENWLGSFNPGKDDRQPENLGDWRVWYRIERG